jgi:hypothetical protein
MNNVVVFGEVGDKGFCNDGSKELVMKSLKMWGWGTVNCQKKLNEQKRSQNIFLDLVFNSFSDDIVFF